MLSTNNIVIETGRITKDVQLEYTPTNKAVAKFSIAVDNGKDANGNKKNATFVNCVAWEKTAEAISKYFTKGKAIQILGSYKTDNYEKDGAKRTYTYVLVELFGFCPETRVHTENKSIAEEIEIEGFSAMDDGMPF